MTLDMFEELYIDLGEKRKPGRQSESKEHWLDILKSDATFEDKQNAFFGLLEWYYSREASLRNRTILQTSDTEELIRIIHSCRETDPECLQHAGWLFSMLGGRSFDYHDYETALKLYQESMAFELKNPSPAYLSAEVRETRPRYFRLNNIGFCLNFLKRFDEAEEYLRAAVDLYPPHFFAWKNLGVSLEHLGKYKEAAEAYWTGIRRSAKGEIHIKHLRRLIDRQPSLCDMPWMSVFKKNFNGRDQSTS